MPIDPLSTGQEAKAQTAEVTDEEIWEETQSVETSGGGSGGWTAAQEAAEAAAAEAEAQETAAEAAAQETAAQEAAAQEAAEAAAVGAGEASTSHPGADGEPSMGPGPILSPIELTPPATETESAELQQIQQGGASPSDVLRYVQEHGHPELRDEPTPDGHGNWIFCETELVSASPGPNAGPIERGEPLLVSDGGGGGGSFTEVPASYPTGIPGYRYNFPSSKPILQGSVELPEGRVDVSLKFTGKVGVAFDNPSAASF